MFEHSVFCLHNKHFAVNNFIKIPTLILRVKKRIAPTQLLTVRSRVHPA